MEKKSTKFTGDVGEELAARFLMKRGFSIVERNYRKKWGEIDIIAKKQKTLHFVEVKTQTWKLGFQVVPEHGRRVSHENNKEVTREPSISGSRVTDEYRPEEKVHPEKIKRMKRAIETYMAEIGVPRETELNDPSKPDLYIDVVTVLLDINNKKAKVDMIENIIM